MSDNNQDDDSLIPESWNETSNDLQGIARSIQAFGFDPKALGQAAGRNIYNILRYAYEKFPRRGNKLGLPEDEMLQLIRNASAVSDPTLQEIIGELVARAADPEKDRSTYQLDLQAVSMLTPDAAALLLFVTKVGKHGQTLTAEELNVPNLSTEDIANALDSLALARCMEAINHNAVEWRRKSEDRPLGILLEPTRFEVTRMGERIGKTYSPRNAGDARQKKVS